MYVKVDDHVFQQIWGKYGVELGLLVLGFSACIPIKRNDFTPTHVLLAYLYSTAHKWVVEMRLDASNSNGMKITTYY